MSSLHLLKSLLNFRSAPTGPTKMVFLVRTDLGMGQGKIASQCAHAAVSLFSSAQKKGNVPLNAWLCSGQPKIVVKIGENADYTLQALYEKCKERKMNACLVRDAGRTQVQSGTVTVFGVGPHESALVDEITGKFKIL